MNKNQVAIPSELLMETFEMIGKSTTMSVAEMDAEKKQKLGAAIDHAIHGGAREKVAATLEGIRHGFGLSIANGVERANLALETVRQDAVENKGYAIAKGVVTGPTQIMRGIVLDTAVEVAQIAGSKMHGGLPDLPQHAKSMKGQAVKERSFSEER